MKNTSNYLLPQFEHNDVFNKEDINKAFLDIDAGINALQSTVNDVSAGGASTILEVANARSTFDTIGDRLNNSDLQSSGFINMANYQKQPSEQDYTLALQRALDDSENKILHLEPNKTYEVSYKLTMKNGCLLYGHNSTINMNLSGNIEGLIVNNNCKVTDLTVNVNAIVPATGSGQYQCPVVIGDYKYGTGISNSEVNNVTVSSNKQNSNGILITGDSNNIQLININIPSSNTLGRGILVHWGNDSTPTTTTYHPFNISIKNIIAGNMTYTNYFHAVFLSGVYNVNVENVKCNKTTGSCVYVFAGDYGFTHSSIAHGVHDKYPINIKNCNAISSSLRGYCVDGYAPFTDSYVQFAINYDNCASSGDSNASIEDGFLLMNCSNITINNCSTNGFRNGINATTNCSNISINNGSYNKNRLRGIYFGAGTIAISDSIINSVEAKLNGEIGTTTDRSGILLQNTNNIKIINCLLGDTTNELYQFYGVCALTNALNTILENNYVRGTKTSGIAYYTNSTNGYVDVIKSFKNNSCSSTVQLISTSTIVPINTRSTISGDARLFDSPVKPSAGSWIRGDIAINSLPNNGGIYGWVCVVSGTPGTWRPIAGLTLKGSTASRPTLTSDDYGIMYMDTTLNANGKPIMWNGESWVDYTGTIV